MTYRQGVGPNRLPQGAATQLNAATPPPARPPSADAPEIPVQYAQGEDDLLPDNDNGLSETKQILLDPPYPEYEPSLLPRQRTGRVPRSIVRSLPVLMMAVKDPSAPPMLRALYRAIVRQLDAERRREAP